MKKVAFALIAAILLGCIFSAGCIVTNSETVITYNGEETIDISMKAGDILTINAPGNPTTGYSWEIVSAEGLTVLTAPEDVYKQDEAAPGMTGVGGMYSWQVTADEPGEYLFAAEYKRSWETEVADRMEITITITA